MLPFLEFLSVMMIEKVAPRRLERKPEEPIMESEESVSDFCSAMTTRLALMYLVLIDIIHRTIEELPPRSALDVGCGPGHFPELLIKILECQTVTGVDLSPPMIAMARHRAMESNAGNRMKFCVADAAHLSESLAPDYDVVTFNNAAHHIPSAVQLKQILVELDHIAGPDGTIFVMDLVRLKTRGATERYVQAIGRDYLNRGLRSLYSDFEKSMYAAWTPRELAGMTPRESRRTWYQIVPPGIPVFQVLVAIPERRKKLFRRRGLPPRVLEPLVPHAYRSEWALLRKCMTLAMPRRIVVP